MTHSSDPKYGTDSSGRSERGDPTGFKLPRWADVPLAILTTLASTGMVIAIVWSSLYVPPPPIVAGSPLDMVQVARGHRLYAVSCAACHGVDARGVPNLGRNLKMGFALYTPNDQLAQMIIRGRMPGEPGHLSQIPMPPKGGQPDFSDSDIADVVVYLRSLQDPSRVTGEEPEVHVAVLDDVHHVPIGQPGETTVVQATSTGSSPSSTGVASTSGSSAAQLFPFDKEAALRGKRAYMNCIACHGKDATGLANLGADLLHSDFVRTNSDEALLAFVKKGRMASDPDSKLKLNMPAKGGNPAMKDNQIQDVIAYIRSLQSETSTSSK